MIDNFFYFDWRSKVDVGVYEFRKWLQSVRPFFCSKCAVKKSLIKQTAQFERELDRALSDGRDEDASAAYEVLIAIKMQLCDFPEAGKK